MWALQRETSALAIPTPETMRSLRTAGMVAWGAAVVGIGLLTALLIVRPGARPSHAMVLGGWAVAELPAIYGLVRWSITKDPRWALLGVLFAVVVLVVYPPRVEQARSGAPR